MTDTFFLIISIGLFLNLILKRYKKIGYSLRKMTYVLGFLFIFGLIILILDIPEFITIDSGFILNNIEEFFVDIVLFNLSMIFFGFSLVLFLSNFINKDNPSFNLSIPANKTAKAGSIAMGKIIKSKFKKYNFLLPIDDLERHMFICGSTGTGKSNFLQNFLINFSKHHTIPFFLVEFKGEYHFLQEKIENIIILWPGENFSINIFNPLSANPSIHAERIFDILKSGQFLGENAEYSPQMEKVLVEILTNVCEDKSLQSWEGFKNCCQKYLDTNKKEIPMLKQTLISLKNRIRRFSQGPLKAIFESETVFTLSRIFDQNIILDLSSIIRLGGEKEDALFFLNMILKYLWDKNLSKGAFNYEGIKHITIIEDAQYFAPQGLLNKSKLTSYLEDIALLQRGTGECLITLSTRPNISKEILANNGIVLTFKNHIEKDIICELLNLDEEKKYLLSSLKEGQCIVRINSIQEPFILEIPLVSRKYPTISEIEGKNTQIFNNKEESFNEVDNNILKKNIIKMFQQIKSKLFTKNLSFFSTKSIESEINNDPKILASNNLNKNEFEKFQGFIIDLYNKQNKKNIK